MKKIGYLFLVLILFMVTGCITEQIDPVIVYYTVEFNSAGGSFVESQSIQEGKKAMKPTNPIMEDSIFKGWYLEDTLYDFTSSVTEDITLTAKWETNFETYGMNVIEITLSDMSITESGFYTSMEEVGTFIYTFHRLPDNYRTKSNFKKENYTEENKLSVGGDVFYNREGLLPFKQGRTFTECDIDYTGNSRNAKRIVYSSDFLIFYTSDHYSSFSILRFI